MKVFILLVLPLIFLSFFFINSEPEKEIVVLDGDTIIFEGKKIRLLGIEAPEENNPFFERSKSFLEEVIKKGKVRLEKDFREKDKYGRLLRYVFVDDMLINKRMVREGLALTSLKYKNFKYFYDFLEAEKEARKENKNIWEISEFFGCLIVEDIKFNPKGLDNLNLDKEYFVLKNVCDFEIKAENWFLNDRSFRTFYLNFTLKKGKKLKIISGSGNSSSSKIYLNSDFPIWNNDHDSLFIFDENLKLVVYYSY